MDNEKENRIHITGLSLTCMHEWIRVRDKATCDCSPISLDEARTLLFVLYGVSISYDPDNNIVAIIETNGTVGNPPAFFKMMCEAGSHIYMDLDKMAYNMAGFLEHILDDFQGKEAPSGDSDILSFAQRVASNEQ